MIRFVADGDQGRVLGMGLSFGNLDALGRDHPIVFELAPYGSSGQLIIACGDESTVKRAMAASPDGHVIVLTPRTLDTLRAGQPMTLSMAELGVPGLAAGLLFAAETEFELIARLREIGMVGPDTAIEGLEEYYRHARGEVESCPLCRERRHGKAAPSSKLVVEHEDWRERIYRHPYLVVLAALTVCALLAVAIELMKGAPPSPPPQEVSGPPPLSERTRAWIASDQLRRQLLDERAPGAGAGHERSTAGRLAVRRQDHRSASPGLEPDRARETRAR